MHMRVDFWEGFSSVKALVLRNCESLTVLSLPVGLVILSIHNCPLLAFVEVERVRTISDSVRSFTWNNQESSSFMMTRQSIVAHSQRLTMEVGSFALQMRWLHELCLANTSITRFENMSKCWPQLRRMTIRESCIGRIHFC